MKQHVCADEGAQPGELLRATEKEDDARCPPHIHSSAGGGEPAGHRHSRAALPPWAPCPCREESPVLSRMFWTEQ